MRLSRRPPKQSKYVGTLNLGGAQEQQLQIYWNWFRPYTLSARQLVIENMVNSSFSNFRMFGAAALPLATITAVMSVRQVVRYMKLHCM